jgi:hypothetical protein
MVRLATSQNILVVQRLQRPTENGPYSISGTDCMRMHNNASEKVTEGHDVQIVHVNF